MENKLVYFVQKKDGRFVKHIESAEQKNPL
jgi:hypothetical protein